MSNTKKSSGFTLVELIVVIVILAILATIAFLSFSSQSASARDSTRLSDMSNIAKGLSVFNATAGSYPLPDNPITISASGITIGKQGYAGSSVLGMIKISNGGKDPLDNSTYYTYSVNANSSKFQILGFLEDGSSSALSLSPDFAKSGLKDVFADPTSYSGRYVMTKGDQLGILLQSGSLVPLQSPGSITGTGVDIIKTNTEYRVQFNNKDSLIGSGSKLVALKNNSSLLPYDPSLIGYWDMETLVGSGLLADLSGNGSNGIIVGGISVGGSDGNGKTGKATNFDGIDGKGIRMGKSILNGTNVKEFTYSLYIKPSNLSSTGLNWILGSRGSYADRFFKQDGQNLNFELFETNNGTSQSNHIIVAGQLTSSWAFISGVFNNGKTSLYINGNKVAVDNTFGIANLDFNHYYIDFMIGGEVIYPSWGHTFNGLIDDVRVYNRALSDSEISNLYNATK